MNINRRDFLKIMGAFAGGVLAKSLIDIKVPESDKMSTSTPPVSTMYPVESRLVESTVLPEFKIDYPEVNLLAMYAESDPKIKKEIASDLVEIIKLSPHSDERMVAENKMWQEIEDNKAPVGDVVFALAASAHPNGRAWGMQLLFDMCQKGELTKYGAMPISEAQIQWADEMNLDEKGLMVALWAYRPAMELLTAGMSNFLEAVPEESQLVDVENRMPNPGVLTGLLLVENGFSLLGKPRAYANIGGGWSHEEVNVGPDWFPSGHDDLKYIAGVLRDLTDLPYVENETDHTIPGSLWISSPTVLNGSGGAVGVQFMPKQCRLFMDWTDKANQKLNNKYPAINPLDPIMGTMMGYLFLAAEFYERHPDVDTVTEVVRPGYWKGDTDRMMAALYKWNPNYDEANRALATGTSFYDSFVNPDK